MKEKEQAQGATLDEIIKDKRKLKNLVEALAGASRRERQQSAHMLAEVARRDATLLVPYANDLIDALNRPEAQTRWEVLDALCELIAVDSRLCDKAIVGAETALFDENSGPLRLAAMRFLCKLGSTTNARSAKIWPLIDEGIQCYHGDAEFMDMLLAVNEFSTGKLDASVKKELAARMEFDTQNGKGLLKKRATQIYENVSA